MYSKLTPSDVNYVLSRCPSDIISLLKQSSGKLFLAGGFIRAVIAGEKCADIDLFGGSPESLLEVAKTLTLKRQGRYFQTDNAITVLSPPRHPVQFITRWLYSSPVSLINSFDFTVCQAAIWAEEVPPNPVIPTIELVGGGTKKKKKQYTFRSICSPDFYSDLAARRLCYTSPIRDEDAGGSMLRIIKYLKKGYNVQTYALGGVIARIIAAIDFKQLPKKHEDQEPWLRSIVVGLLREVDPLLVIDGVEFRDEHKNMFVAEDEEDNGEEKQND